MIDIKVENGHWKECGVCSKKKVCFQFTTEIGYEYNSYFYICSGCLKKALKVINRKDITLEFDSDYEMKEYDKQHER